MKGTNISKRFLLIPSSATSPKAISHSLPKGETSRKAKDTINIKLLLGSGPIANQSTNPQSGGISIIDEGSTSATCRGLFSRVKESMDTKTAETTRLKISTSTSGPKISSKKIFFPSSRDKRLIDIETYRQMRAKGSSITLTQSSEILNAKPSSLVLTSPQKIPSLTSTTSILKKKNTAKSSELRCSISGYAPEPSTALSIDSPIREPDTPLTWKKVTDPIFSRDNFSPELRIKGPSESPSREHWKEYHQKANEILIKARRHSRRESPKEQSPRGDSLGGQTPSVDQSPRKRITESERLQAMKPKYAQFVKEKLHPSLTSRLDTLGTFAFTTMDKQDNKELPVFIQETNSCREPEGSMTVVDLWSQKHKHNVLKQAFLGEAKRTVERFTILRSKKRTQTVEKQQRGMGKTDDEKAKERLIMKELKQATQKNQEESLLSPMKRHLNLKGKTLYKEKRPMFDIRERGGTVSAHREDKKQLNAEFGMFFNDLDQVQRDNQDDYIKLMDVCSASEKVNLKHELKELLRRHRINRHLDIEGWKLKQTL